MRTILLAVALMGCGTNEGAHDVVTCGSGWAHLSASADPNETSPIPASCEAACEEPPANYVLGAGSACSVNHNAATCTYFVYEGVKGCCLPGRPSFPTASDDVTFAECDAH